MKEKKNNTISEDKIFKKEKRIYKIIIAILFFFILIFILGVGFIVQRSLMSSIDKPIIYLYPEEETDILVKFKEVNKLTHTYPKYSDEGWNVLAKPNGDLIDLKTGRSLYSLYYESKNDIELNMSVGFVVEGKNTISFLEEKLELLGLTEREANEFVIYWLPQMENNKYNFIYFATTEELNKYMPIEVIPEPDTCIRILMKFKPLDKYIEVEEQEIKTPERKGFVLVEWGGTRYE